MRIACYGDKRGSFGLVDDVVKQRKEGLARKIVTAKKKRVVAEGTSNAAALTEGSDDEDDDDNETLATVMARYGGISIREPTTATAPGTFIRPSEELVIETAEEEGEEKETPLIRAKGKRPLTVVPLTPVVTIATPATAPRAAPILPSSQGLGSSITPPVVSGRALLSALRGVTSSARSPSIIVDDVIQKQLRARDAMQVGFSPPEGRSTRARLASPSARSASTPAVLTSSSIVISSTAATPSSTVAVMASTIGGEAFDSVSVSVSVSSANLFSGEFVAEGSARISQVRSANPEDLGFILPTFSTA